jgi:hypothetical protein
MFATTPMGTLALELAGDRPTMIYPKPDFEPATYAGNILSVLKPE